MPKCEKKIKDASTCTLHHFVPIKIEVVNKPALKTIQVETNKDNFTNLLANFLVKEQSKKSTN